MQTTTTIPTTTGMLVSGDRFSFEGAATVFTVIEVIEDEDAADDRLRLLVAPYISVEDTGTFVLPTTYSRPVVRFP